MLKVLTTGLEHTNFYFWSHKTAMWSHRLVYHSQERKLITSKHTPDSGVCLFTISTYLCPQHENNIVNRVNIEPTEHVGIVTVCI